MIERVKMHVLVPVLVPVFVPVLVALEAPQRPFFGKTLQGSLLGRWAPLPPLPPGEAFSCPQRYSPTYTGGGGGGVALPPPGMWWGYCF